LSYGRAVRDIFYGKNWRKVELDGEQSVSGIKRNVSGIKKGAAGKRRPLRGCEGIV